MRHQFLEPVARGGLAGQACTDQLSVLHQHALGYAAPGIAIVHRAAVVREFKQGVEFGDEILRDRRIGRRAKHKQRHVAAREPASRIGETIQQRPHGIEVAGGVAAAHGDNLPGVVEFFHLHRRVLQFWLL